MAKVELQPDAFHGDWNYTIHPTQWKTRRIACFVTGLERPSLVPGRQWCLAFICLSARLGPRRAVAGAGRDGGLQGGPVHSSVGFTIRYFVSNVSGNFRDFDGTVHYDRAQPAAAKDRLLDDGGAAKVYIAIEADRQQPAEAGK
jgi:hypothetical protein